MLSAYFTLKTETEAFKTHLNNLLNSLKGKKVLIYGAGEGFVELRKRFDFDSLNIVAISDIKFTEAQIFDGLNAIEPKKIPTVDFDVILVTQENSTPILFYLRNELLIENKDIECIFKYEIPDENINFNFLAQYNFAQNVNKLIKKYKGKKVVIYGAGVLFQLINKYYDLSGLNIVAISDMKFESHEKDEEFLGYKVCSPNEIADIKPDYVFVATRNYIDIAEDLYCYTLKGTGIKIRPLVKKNFFDTVKEIWYS